MTQIRQETLSLPVTKLFAENPLPRFADPADRPLLDGGLLQEEKIGFAENTGLRVLPYRMQDRYAAATEPQTIPTVILENDRLRATFLPGYGGRLYSLWDRQKNRECLYRNSELVIRNLALRNAWFSGGIEWNFGHFGHTYFTCQDVFFAACTDEQGQSFLRMYEFERCKQVTFQVDFHLPMGADALSAHMRLENRLSEDAPIFLWTNTALPEEPGMHVYSGTDQVIAQHSDPVPSKSYFYHGQLPDLGVAGLDATDPSGIPFACEYFYQNPPTQSAAFEAARYADSRFFAERSTANFPYRKVFCWGNHAGGKNWQRFLAGQGSGDYLEVQAGLAKSQVHPSWIAGNSVLHITQQFAFSDLTTPRGDCGEVQAAVERILPTPALNAMHAHCTAISTKKANRLLHEGYGWGALEKRRDPDALPLHLDFPESTLGPEQAPWLALLKGREMEECASFMVSRPWMELLEKEANKSAAAWNHLGIAYMEQGQPVQAEAAWMESLRIRPTALAYRNLAWVAQRQEQPGEAISQMKMALAHVSGVDMLRPYAIEYLGFLTDAGQYKEAFAYYRSLPEALQKEERTLLSALKSAFEENEDSFLDALFAARFTVIKEGDVSMADLWFLREAKRKAKMLGVPCTEALVAEIRQTAILPENLDFRMANASGT